MAMRRKTAGNTARQAARFETRLRQLRAFDALPLDGRVAGPVVDLLFCWSPTTRWRRREAGLLPAPAAGDFYLKRQLLPLLAVHRASVVHRSDDRAGSVTPPIDAPWTLDSVNGVVSTVATADTG